MTYREVFEKEIKRYNLNWCRGCDSRAGHKRGFVLYKDKTTVHYDREIATRSTLFGGLHEIGHCINDEKGLHSYQCEMLAEDFARSKFEKYKIPLPRKRVSLGVSYIKRKKRHADNIKKGRKVK
jgi:hypothetical protein